MPAGLRAIWNALDFYMDATLDEVVHIGQCRGEDKLQVDLADGRTFIVEVREV